MNNNEFKITYFPEEQIKEIALPERFTFPFYYEPHPLTKLAAAELQQYLESLSDLDHNFGLTSDSNEPAIGKMFGVLAVEDQQGKIGYLSAFSGKLADSNNHLKFVPPVFDMLTENSFFLKEQEVIDAINRAIEDIEADTNYTTAKKDLERSTEQSAQELSAFKQQLKANKDNRKLRRDELSQLTDNQDNTLTEAELAKESHYDRHRLRLLKEHWKIKNDEALALVAGYEQKIENLKNERKERSGALQEQLFAQYSFLNISGKQKSLSAIFEPTAFGRPPAGAGECATPKLLQYAFKNGFRPLAMAEFWWGAAPKSDIRQHKQFYPACAGKCKPILAHMLEGMPVEDNPFLQPADDNLKIDIIFEDEYLLIVNKPAGLRSVPGVDIWDSVYSRLKSTLHGIEPLMVHRLDMGTSGLLVVAKAPEIHKHIQRQFLEHKVRKRYTALLAKPIDKKEGTIDLPLAADPFNRPRQIVCTDTGKPSLTKWKVIELYATTTKIHFWPLTGRTHQLRMHSAHELGLNAPIVGDDLYGTAADRLYLHAAYLSFTHPITKERMEFEVAEDF